MKKGFTALAASAVVCSMAFASPTANEPSFTGLNATEHAALFGEGSTAQAVALGGAEMKATEGEIIWMPLVWAGVRASAMWGIRYTVWGQYSQRHPFNGNSGWRW
jgi:hypothetical protein